MQQVKLFIITIIEVFLLKQIEKEAVYLTNEALNKYWHLDYHFVIEQCAEDAIWLGARQDEFIVGRDKIEADFEKTTIELQPCHLINAQYHAIAADSKNCTVTGRYIVTTENYADFFLQTQQRCTFVWQKTNEGLKIKHIHISNPIGEMKLEKDEKFPNTIGKMAHRYLEDHINHVNNDITLTAYGDGGSLYLIKPMDVLHISAIGKDSVVKTVHGVIYTRTSIADFAKQAKNLLLTVHRSYLVNPNYISLIERYSVIMTNGDKIPIPAKKYNDLRNTLLKLHRTDENI